jgi:hypothetical protein
MPSERQAGFAPVKGLIQLKTRRVRRAFPFFLIHQFFSPLIVSRTFLVDTVCLKLGTLLAT